MNLPALARSVKGLTPSARHILLLLATYADRQGRAWPSVGTLAEQSGMHRTSVQRALRVLEEAGHIEPEKNSRGRSRMYAIKLSTGGSTVQRGGSTVQPQGQHGAARSSIDLLRSTTDLQAGVKNADDQTLLAWCREAGVQTVGKTRAELEAALVQRRKQGNGAA